VDWVGVGALGLPRRTSWSCGGRLEGADLFQSSLAAWGGC
jgi:hypothetical protein